MNPNRRDGVEGGGTQRQRIKYNRRDPVRSGGGTPTGREAYKGETRKRSNDAGQGVGGGHSTVEASGKPRGGKGRYFHQANETGKGSRTAPAREGSTPAQSSQAQSARKT